MRWFFLFLSTVDDFSSFNKVYPMSFKSGCLDHYISFVQSIENLLQLQYAEAQCDRGGEFVNHKFTCFLNNHGIL